MAVFWLVLSICMHIAFAVSIFQGEGNTLYWVAAVATWGMSRIEALESKIKKMDDKA